MHYKVLCRRNINLKEQYVRNTAQNQHRRKKYKYIFSINVLWLLNRTRYKRENINFFYHVIQDVYFRRHEEIHKKKCYAQNFNFDIYI